MHQQEAKPVRPWLITRDAGFTSRFSHGILSRQITLQAAFCLCNTINMVDTLFCSYMLDFLVYKVGITGSVAGVMLMVSELFNVVIGILASVLMDLYPFASFGKHRFWIMVTVIPLFLTFTVLWLPFPDDWLSPQATYNAKLMFYTAALLIFNVFYGTLIVAYEGSIPLLASDSATLARLNVLRLCIGSSSSVVAVLFAAITDLIMAGSDWEYFVQSAIVGGVVAFLFLFWVALAEERDAPPPKLVRQGSCIDTMPVLIDFKPSARRLLRHMSIDAHHHYNIDEYHYLVDNYYGAREDDQEVGSPIDLPASLPEEDFWGSTELGGDAERREIDEEYSRSAPGGLLSLDEEDEWHSSEGSPRQTPRLNSPKFQFLHKIGSLQNVGGPEKDEGAQQITGRVGSADGITSPSFRGGVLIASRSPGWSLAETITKSRDTFGSDDALSSSGSASSEAKLVENSPATAGLLGPFQSMQTVKSAGCLPRIESSPRQSEEGRPRTPLQLEPKISSPRAQNTGLKLWLEYSKELLPRRPFWILIMNHFLLWAILTFTQAALPAFLHSYLEYETSMWIGGSVLVILVLQIGHAVAQLLMGFFPKQLSPEAVLRMSLLIMVVAKVVFLFGFDQGLPPAWVFLVAGVDGLGQGGMFAVYEIMIPEVVWEDEARTGIRKENLIYGWVDSVRELSLALSFFGVGLILDYTKPSMAERLAVGLAPLPLLGVCAFLHWLYPHVILSSQETRKDPLALRVDSKREAQQQADLKAPLLQNEGKTREHLADVQQVDAADPPSTNVGSLSQQDGEGGTYVRIDSTDPFLDSNSQSSRRSLDGDMPFVMDLETPEISPEGSPRTMRRKLDQDDSTPGHVVNLDFREHH